MFVTITDFLMTTSNVCVFVTLIGFQDVIFIVGQYANGSSDHARYAYVCVCSMWKL